MISVCQLYNDHKGRENVWQGGSVRPESFVSWLHEVQIEIQNELIKSLGNNQDVTDNLRPFLKSVQTAVIQAGGKISYPKNYRRFSSLRFFSVKSNGPGSMCSNLPVLCNGEVLQIDKCDLKEEDKAEMLSSEEMIERSIQMVPNKFWGSVSDDEIVAPSIMIPYATQNDNGFKVLPKGIGYVVLDYISIPERPTFIYTRDAKQNIICDSNKCKNLEWGEEMIPEILARMKKRYSAFVGNSEAYKEGEQERTITTS
jgi:hypothetical protein